MHYIYELDYSFFKKNKITRYYLAIRQMEKGHMIILTWLITNKEPHLEPCQISAMEAFVKIVIT